MISPTNADPGSQRQALKDCAASREHRWMPVCTSRVHPRSVFQKTRYRYDASGDTLGGSEFITLYFYRIQDHRILTPPGALPRTAAITAQFDVPVFRWTPDSQTYAIHPLGRLCGHIHLSSRIEQSQCIRRIRFQRVIGLKADLVRRTHK